MDEQLNITLINVYAEQPTECQTAPLATAEISFREFMSIFINSNRKSNFTQGSVVRIYPCSEATEQMIESLAKSLTEDQRKKVNKDIEVVGMLFSHLMAGHEEIDTLYREVNGGKKLRYRKFVLRLSVQNQILRQTQSTSLTDNFDPSEWDRIRSENIWGQGTNAYSRFRQTFFWAVKYMHYWANLISLGSDSVPQDLIAYQTLVKFSPWASRYPFMYHFSTQIGLILYQNQLTYLENVVLVQGKVVTPCPINPGDDFLLSVIPKEDAIRLYSSVSAALVTRPNLLSTNECVKNLFGRPFVFAPNTPERQALYQLIKSTQRQ
ncbi:hypothetical protein [Pseudaeromonas pectinilytica]